ncbi:MAG: alpha/beta hydrolase [Agathobacter sp.]|nr:alpha/beta hydrolase [Agathobacter sp.]
MEFLIGLIGTILVIIVLFLVFMACFAVRPKVHTLEYELGHLKQYPFTREENLEIENEHTVKTFDGQELWVGFVPGNPENKHYVVLSHGYTSTRYGMYKYVVLWRKMGYNCVIYDNRGHGVNKPATITFGIKESRDLMAVIEDTYERYGRDIRIGLHGESMGAGLQLMALEYKPKVDFIINDCGYSEILPVLRWKTQQGFRFPGWLADLASPVCKLLFGYRFEDVRPIDRLRENEIPICFVHGTNDTFTAHWHSEKMYEANKGYKELHLFEGVDHADCVVDDTERYMKMMQAFVKKVYA